MQVMDVPKRNKNDMVQSLENGWAVPFFISPAFGCLEQNVCIQNLACLVFADTHYSQELLALIRAQFDFPFLGHAPRILDKIK